MRYARHVAQRTIDLVRHGAYGEDGHLTSVGVAQVQLLAARYQAEGGPTEIWASPIVRARQTGEILGRALGIKPRTVGDLAEGIPSVGSGLAESLDSGARKQLSETRARFERLLKRVRKSARGGDKHLLLACHGNVARYIWLRALDLDPPAWWSMHIHHASVSRLVVTPRGVRGVRFNDVGHLPPALQSET